ncbi:MAG: hypothetical protein LBL40_00210 [Coxiellaceae bacterium]|jgi:uncharacterized lipoprotein|nr:hypothetical protein [Coxiellaceae bacterium]
MKFVKICILASVAIAILGCSISNKLDKSKIDDKPLVLPSDIDDNFIENHYPIPKSMNNDRNSTKVSLLPPGSRI